MSTDRGRTHSCRECGAQLDSAASRCWLCGTGLDALPPVQPGDPPVLRRPVQATPTFHLDTLILIVTLITVGLGAFVETPGLGILFAVVATPAVVRAAAVTRIQSQRGAAVGVGAKLLAFLGSFLVMAVIIVSVSIAFFVTCFIGFCGSWAALQPSNIGREPQVFFMIGVLSGILAGVVVAVVLLRSTWPRRR